MDRKKIWNSAKKVWEIESATIRDLDTLVSMDELAACAKLILGCKGKIVTSGAGTSGAAAKKISHSLSCIERPSFFLTPSDAVHGSLGAVTSDDLAILISKGGNTKEIVNLIPALKTKKTTFIGVTENYGSELAKTCDQVLRIKIKKEADSFNMLATSSTLAVISVFDAICISIMQISGYTKDRFAVIHPEGAVGERLKKNIKEKK